MRNQMKELLKHRSLQSLTFGKAKTAGRNSSGRITVFHRGGGAKRLQRKIDLKRGTTSTGIVERIEYDPNRSSRIALVRWIDGVVRNNNASKTRSVSVQDAKFEANSEVRATVRDYFSLSAMSGSVGTGKDGIFGGGGFGLPRIAVAGAKPDFFAKKMMDEEVDGKESVSLSEIQKSREGSDVWDRRIRRSAALSWHNGNSGLKGLVQSELKVKVDQGSLLPSQVISYGLRSGRSSTYLDAGRGLSNVMPQVDAGSKVDCVPVSYVLASHQLEAGKMVMNCDWSRPSKSGFSRPADGADSLLQFRDLVRAPSKGSEEGGDKVPASRRQPATDDYDILDLNSKVGNCIPLADIRMGTWVHNIEYRPGQGGKLVRAAGTYAKVVKHQNSLCLVRLPSGAEKFIDSRCRATIGMVSNPSHGAKKLRKAGHSRWLGIRPTVRGVAMNPIDHPHGGGEGRTKGGRPSVSPWGKPTKSGFRTGVGKRKA